MTRDPVRWLSGGEPEELLLLMRVGAEELAPPDVVARVGARLQVAALAETERPPTPSPAPESSPALHASSIGIKALGLALGLGAAGLSLYPLVRPTVPASAPSAGSARSGQTPAALPRLHAAPASPASAGAASSAPPPITSLDGAPREQTEPAAHPRKARGRTLVRPSQPVAQPVDARLEQARLLERARRELSAQPARALTLLREHATRFPDSWLEEEREAIWIRALAQTGQSAEAHAKLMHFKTRFPRSVHAQRLEHALASP